MSLTDRLALIAQHAGFFEPFTGAFSLVDLTEACAHELGASTVQLPRTILHIISGNTLHAAHQTLLHGLIVAEKNLLKLPSDALLDFTIPDCFRDRVEIARALPDDWISQANAMVVYGADATVRHFRELCPLEIPFVGHGHRVGIAVIRDPSPEAARLAARDIGQFNQQGCLSLQTIFAVDPRTFAERLAQAMKDFERNHPRGPLGPSEAGAISNLREEIRYLNAQEPNKYNLWQSPDTTAWTVVFEDDPKLTLSPGNRTVFVRPLPKNLATHLEEIPFLSGVGTYPFEPGGDLPAPRVFPLGQAQSPPFLWPHDGIPPLASLVTHQTKEPSSPNEG